MLSIINLTAKHQFGPDIFPINGHLYCEPVIRLFRNQDTNKDLQDENVIIETREIYYWIQHHLYSGGRHTTANLQRLIDDTDELEIICDEAPTFAGDAAKFVDQLDEIKTAGTNRAVAIVSVFCYLWPKAVYDELFERGYKVILDELFESRVSHLYGFFIWCSLVGIPTENFIVLSGRYNAHPNLNTADIKIQNRDMDFDSMGARVVNYPAFFWHFEHQVQETIPLSDRIEWGTNCNFEFPKQALLLNRAERFHRLLAIAYLHRHDCLDKCLWSMKGTHPGRLLDVLRVMADPIFRETNNISWYDDEMIDIMYSIVPRDIEQDSRDNHKIPKKFFEETKFSFVTETIGGSGHQVWDSLTSAYPAFSSHLGYYADPVFRLNHRRYGFITEKTFRPLAVGHPFVALGNNKLLYTLQALGFETYNSVWNESYDKTVVDIDRFTQTLDRVVDLINNGFNERAAKEIAEHNKARFWDDKARKDVLNKWLVEPLLDAYYGRV